MLSNILSQKLTTKAKKSAVAVSGTGIFALYTAYPDQTQYGLASAAALAVAGSGAWSSNWVLTFPHRWKWIHPLHETLKAPLELDDDVRPSKYIRIPRGYQNREKVGKIYLPAQFTGVDVQTVQTIVRNKLGLSDCSVQFKLAGRHPHVVIRQTPRPPAKVMFQDHEKAVVKASESAPLIGIGPNGKQVSVDLDSESPHILVSASTGGGKSVITRALACQLLHEGGQMVVLDFKRHSHKWARGLPQVDYCREIADIHDALVALGEEGHRRNVVVDDHQGDGDPDVGPRMILLLEEANATVTKLKRYWTSIRHPKLDPKESPAIDALREVLFMGRAVRMHVLLVAQSATAAALGGPEVRECFATRILSRYTVNAWKMLVPEVYPIPRSTRHVGRAQVVLGGVATETQVLFFSDSEATEWASSGSVAPAPGMSRDTNAGPPTRGNTRDSHAGVTEAPVLTLVKSEPLSLADAAREGVVPMKADALRQAKRRDPEFPAGANGRWTAEELQAWYANRQSS